MVHDPDTKTTELLKAIEGLTYPSESDEPFDAFCWDGIGGPDAPREKLAAQIGTDRSIEPVAFESFFAQLQDADDAARYEQLRRTLKSQLNDPQVFRAGAGEVRVDVYLLGRTREGNWAGVHTVSIES
jgi:hypothetical protein